VRLAIAPDDLKRRRPAFGAAAWHILPRMSTDLRRGALRWMPVAACAAILLWHSLQYNFVTDDAYISFVYSRNLAEHGQLTFNLGHPVEGYTNFLWTFVLGLLMLVGIPPEWSSRVLGTGCGIGVLIVAFRLTERLLGRPRPTSWRELSGWPYLPSLLLALSSGFACWTSGGLETQLFTLLCALAIEAYVASEDGEPMRLVRCGMYLALAAMTRPEGLLVAAVIVGHRIALNLGYRRRVLPDVAERRTILSFLLLWAPWFAWRWWYYGWLFPNTYYVKATGALHIPVVHGRTGAQQIWHDGGYYLLRWVQQTHLIWIAPLLVIGALAARPRTARFAFTSLAVVLTAAYLVYTASVGGDFMGLHRFIMPVFVLVAICAALGLERLAGWAARVRVPAAGVAVLGAAVALAFAWSQWRLTSRSLRWGDFGSDNGIDTPAYLIAYTEDRAAIGRAMRDCFSPGDFSIVGGAGAQPYYGRMAGIDVFGLVSERIAHEEPRTRARAGHDKWGSDRLLLQYDPTFVFSCYDITPSPAQHRNLDYCAGFWLARGYERVSMPVPGIHSLSNMNVPASYYTFLVKKSRHFACPGLVR
jgi:arabinofuranosyltransferase